MAVTCSGLLLSGAQVCTQRKQWPNQFLHLKGDFKLTQPRVTFPLTSGRLALTRPLSYSIDTRALEITNELTGAVILLNHLMDSRFLKLDRN